MTDDQHITPPGCIVENQHITCFDALNDNERQILRDHTVDILYKRGEIIVKQGSFTSLVVFLKEGLNKICPEGQLVQQRIRDDLPGRPGSHHFPIPGVLIIATFTLPIRNGTWSDTSPISSRHSTCSAAASHWFSLSTGHSRRPPS